LRMWIGGWESVCSRAPNISKARWDLSSSIVQGTLDETYFNIPSIYGEN
jgi:hypothetical protein